MEGFLCPAATTRKKRVLPNFILTTMDRKPLFLGPGELKKANQYHSSKVDQLYRDAAKNNNSLLLDISCPGVKADVNIFQRAERMQKLIKAGGKDMVMIVVWGAGIATKKTVTSDWKYYQKKEKISVAEALKRFDCTNSPVAVIGYTMMIRGDSFRSSKRVPSHILESLGRGMSIDKVMQSVGRATGKFKRRLSKNGFEHVKVLMKSTDYDTVLAYPQFLQELQTQLDHGVSLREALSGAHTYAWKSNYAFRQTRTIGQKRLQLSQVEKHLQFQHAPAGKRLGAQTQDEEANRSQPFALHLRKINSNNGGRLMSTKEYVNAVEEGEQFNDRGKDCVKELRQLFDDGVMVREKGICPLSGRKNTWFYHVNSEDVTAHNNDHQQQHQQGQIPTQQRLSMDDELASTNKLPTAQYIKDRLTKVQGMTIDGAIGTQVSDRDNNSVEYCMGDLVYDLNQGYLCVPTAE